MKKSPDTTSNSLEKLNELLHGIKYCMMTTVEQDGSMRSRPMYTQEEEFDGELWFFTGLDSAKVEEIQAEHRVNLSYIGDGHKKFVSVSGHAKVVHDRAKMTELWKPYYKAWFPGGLDDPNLCLLKVEVDYAEYWDTPTSPLAHLVGFVKAVTGGGPQKIGENQKVEVSPGGQP